MPEIELGKIHPNPLNPRLDFGEYGLGDLTDSVKQVGLLEPIIVRPMGEDSYEIVVGERRFKAAKKAGLRAIPVVIRDYTDAEVMEINLVENVQREDLSDVEKGNACIEIMKKLPDSFPTIESIAQKIGVSSSLVGQWIRTTKMPKEIQKLISPTEKGRELIPKGFISADTARVIQRQINDTDKQIEIAKEFAERPTPVKQVREIVKLASQEHTKPIRDIFKEVVENAPIFLPFSKVHSDSIVDRRKTQTSRKTKDPRLKKGVIVRAQVTHFADLEIEDVYRKKLADFTEEDAKREGGYTLAEFKEVWESLHGKWDPNETVYVIKFNLAGVLG